MAIWFRDYALEEIQRVAQGNMCEHLGIEFTAIGDDWLEASMPVDERTRQPAGLLHGGASVALAETLGSVAGQLCIDPASKYCVGQEINANHLRPIRSGRVIGRAGLVYLARSSQVWQIDIRSERGKLVCVSRLTLAVVAARDGRHRVEIGLKR